MQSIMDFLEINEVDQLSDAWLIEVYGELIMYYSALGNYGDESYIKVATLSMSAEEFVSLVRLD